MLKMLSTGLVAASIVLSTAALAQQEGMAATDGVSRDRGGDIERHGRMSSEDRAAFLDARIAALHAGLKLNADQEKNWPPVEAAMRDLAKTRAELAAQRRERFEAGERSDPIQRLRNASDAMSTRAAGLKRLADASEPLYRSLDEAQKRRMEVLGRQLMRQHGGRSGRHR